MRAAAWRGRARVIASAAVAGERRRIARLAIGAILMAAATHAADLTPADAARFSIGRSSAAPVVLFTLMDPSLTLLPPESLIDARSMALDVDPAGATTSDPVAERDLRWKLGYRHSDLSDRASSETLRADPSTGFSRQLDRDVVDLGLSWRLASSNRLGFGYQLQSARDGGAADGGLSRFLPGSAAATHAFTLGVTREFGAGAPPPAVVAPPLVPLEPLPELTPGA